MVSSPLLGDGFTKEVQYLCAVGSRMALSSFIAERTLRIVDSTAYSSLPYKESVYYASSESRLYIALVSCEVGRRSNSLSVSSSPVCSM